MKRSLIVLGLIASGAVVAQGVLPCVNGGTCSLTSLTVNGKGVTTAGGGPDAGDGLAYVHGGDTLACNFATGSIDGCWSTTTQTFRGDKTLLGDAGLNSLQVNAENIPQSSGGAHVTLKLDPTDCIDMSGVVLGSTCSNDDTIVLANGDAIGWGDGTTFLYGNAGAITIHSPSNTNVNAGNLQVAGNNVLDVRSAGSCSAGQFVTAVNTTTAPTCATPAGGGSSSPDAGDGLQYVHGGDTLACVTATGSVDGCWSIGTQTLRGDKTLLGDAGMNNLNVAQIVLTGATTQLTATGTTLNVGYNNDTFIQLNNGGAAFIATNGHNFGIGNTVFSPAYKLDLRDANNSQGNAVFHAGQATSGAVDVGLYFGMDSAHEGLLNINSDFNPSNNQFRAKDTFAHIFNFNNDGSCVFQSNTGLTAGNTFTGTSRFGYSTTAVTAFALPFQSTATSGNQFACTGAATCNFFSASGQTSALDCGGGTCTASLGTTNATTTTVGRSGQASNINGDNKFGSAKNRGTISLSGGTGTATVLSGALCLCGDENSPLACQPSISGTTLTVTVTGGGTDTVTYFCF